MMIDLVRHVETETGLTQIKARAALGIVLNAADRQGSPLAEELFNTLPGARTLSAQVGGEIGAATGDIARLIEMTPGGRRYVTTQMIATLQDIGLGHATIGDIMPAIGSFMEVTYGKSGFGHMGDLLGKTDTNEAQGKGSIAA